MPANKIKKKRGKQARASAPAQKKLVIIAPPVNSEIPKEKKAAKIANPRRTAVLPKKKISTEKKSSVKPKPPTAKRKTKTKIEFNRTRELLTPRHLAWKIKQIRLTYRLSQADMLMIINPFEIPENRARVSQYENGSRVPSPVEILNYARFAGITMERLVDDEMELPKRLEIKR